MLYQKRRYGSNAISTASTFRVSFRIFVKGGGKDYGIFFHP